MRSHEPSAPGNVGFLQSSAGVRLPDEPAQARLRSLGSPPIADRSPEVVPKRDRPRNAPFPFAFARILNSSGRVARSTVAESRRTRRRADVVPPPHAARDGDLLR